MNHTCPAPAVLVAVFALLVLGGCESGQDETGETTGGIRFEHIASVSEPRLNEISGIETGDGDTLVVHNDDGKPDLFILDMAGELVTVVRIDGADNRDWEDLTRVPGDGGEWLAVGDIGDNLGLRESVRLWFVRLPDPLAETGGSESRRRVPLGHTVELVYPDAPRDCEAMAYDPVDDRILFLTKRDQPPRLYGIDAREALAAERLELEFLGPVSNLRPPGQSDRRLFGKDATWVSQPTGMDINSAGTLAAVITYRSLYLFERKGDQDWAEAFRSQPREFLGPPARHEEAVAFTADMAGLLITAEGYNAPIYRADLPPPRQ